MNPVPCWRVEEDGSTIFVRAKIDVPPAQMGEPDPNIRSVVIVGGGAAGNAAAEMMRRQGFAGELIMLCADDALPYDRPNLSKDYLAATASEDWIPLRTPDFYSEQKIDVRLNASVQSIDRPGPPSCLRTEADFRSTDYSSRPEPTPFGSMYLEPGYRASIICAPSTIAARSSRKPPTLKKSSSSARASSASRRRLRSDTAISKSTSSDHRRGRSNKSWARAR